MTDLFDPSFTQVGKVPVNDILMSLGQIPTDDLDSWERNTYRQDTFRTHIATKSIILKMDDKIDKELWDYFFPVLEPVFDAAAKSRKYKIWRCLFARLNPKSGIPIHTDNGDEVFEVAARHHVAISTNRNVEFFCGGETIYMAPGEIWIINNRSPHAVNNHSPFNRIHLIFDMEFLDEKA